MSLNIIIFITITVSCIVGGAYLIVRSKASDLLLGVSVSLSAGIIASLTFIEFLPKAFSQGNEYTSYFILLGLFVFVVTDKFITPRLIFFNSEPSCKKSGCKTHDPQQLLTSQTACSSIGCLVVCAFFDGIELSVGLKLGQTTGTLMMAALFLHLAPTGALAASLSLAGKLSAKKALQSSQIIAVALLLGFGASFLIEQSAGFYFYLLPVATGVLIYNLLVHLIPSVLKFRWGTPILIGSAVITALSFFSHHS